VEFTLIKSTNSNHEFHVNDGIWTDHVRDPSVDRSSAFAHNHDDANDPAEPDHYSTPFSGGGGRGGRGRGSGGRGEGGANERPVLRERTTNPLTVFGGL
jgi:hypothetical protein